MDFFSAEDVHAQDLLRHIHLLRYVIRAEPEKRTFAFELQVQAIVHSNPEIFRTGCMTQTV